MHVETVPSFKHTTVEVNYVPKAAWFSQYDARKTEHAAASNLFIYFFVPSRRLLHPRTRSRCIPSNYSARRLEPITERGEPKRRAINLFIRWHVYTKLPFNNTVILIAVYALCIHIQAAFDAITIIPAHKQVIIKDRTI